MKIIDYAKIYGISIEEVEFYNKIINGGGLLQYFNYKGKKKGIFIAFKEKEEVFISYSLCHKKNKFNKLFGIIEAYRRIKKNKCSNWIPWTKNQKICINVFLREFYYFHIRSSKYFKENKDYNSFLTQNEINLQKLQNEKGH